MLFCIVQGHDGMRLQPEVTTFTWSKPSTVAVCWRKFAMQDADLDRTESRGWRHIGNPLLALVDALELWQAAKNRGDRAIAADLSQEIAWLCFCVNDIETGMAHALASRRYFAEVGLKEREIIAAAIYAWLLLETGLTVEASEEAVKAVAEAEECDSVLAKSWALNVLAVIFWYCKQLERAEALSLRAVALARTLGDPRLLGWWIINLAGIRSEFAYGLGAAKDEDGLHRVMAEALEMNREAISLAESVGDSWGLHLSLCNAAEYNIAIGRYADAEEDLVRWEAVGPSTGPRSHVFHLNTKSQLLSRQGRWSEALALCDHALELARERRQADSEAHALRSLSEIHEGLGRFDLALACFKRFHDVQSKLAAEEIQRRARFAEIHYDTERLKRLAETATSRAEALARTTQLDPLTGIGNRRLLEGAFQRLRADLQPFCVAVLDLDHFKRINDRYSHAVGDEVLRRVAVSLQSSMRSQDVVARIGGEEFVLVLFGLETEDAISLCRSIIAGLAALSWSEVDVSLSVTASVGIAAHVEATDPDRVMAIADERLYLAKAAGRNRVVASSSGATDHNGLGRGDNSLLAGRILIAPHVFGMNPENGLIES